MKKERTEQEYQRSSSFLPGYLYDFHKTGRLQSRRFIEPWADAAAIEKIWYRRPWERK